MSVDRTELQKIFPGQWDGGNGEYHGLLRARGEELRIECVERDDGWVSSVFSKGEALASTHDPDVKRAIAGSLKEALRALLG